MAAGWEPRNRREMMNIHAEWIDNLHLKGSYLPQEIHQLYFIAIFSTLCILSLFLSLGNALNNPPPLPLAPRPCLCSIGILPASSLDLHHSLGPKSQSAGPDTQITTDAPEESQ